MTFAEEIEYMASGETIEAIVVGPFGWSSEKEPDAKAYGFDRNLSRKPVPQKLKNKPVAWEDVREYLNYTYDHGFGSPECHAVVVWTENQIIQVYEYDGSTGLYSTPRNPRKMVPNMAGGG